ncbi:TPA: hypothetical protein ACF2DE_002894 [Clostridium perfringens]
MRIEDVLIPKNIGKRFKFNLNGQEVITEVKGYYTCGYQKIVLDFIDKIDFEEIEREIDWTKVPYQTKIQVRNSEDEEWVNRYFASYLKSAINDDEDYSFGTLDRMRDDFTKINGTSGGWFKMARIHPSVKIKEEWYKA